MTLPESGWKGYGRPDHPYNRAADQLRRAAVMSDDAGHALREVAFLRWLASNPAIPNDVSLALETALIPYR